MSRITKPTLNKSPLQIPRLVNHQPFAQHSFVQPKHQIKPIKQGYLPTKPKVIVNPNSGGNLPLASNRQPSYSTLQPDEASNLDACMELFLTKASNRPLHQAFESFFRSRFSTRTVYFWEEISSIQTLYCPTANLTTLHSNGIVGYSVFSRSIINTSSPTQHPSYQSQTDSKLIHPNSRVLIFPLWDNRNSIFGVVEIVRDENSPEFTKEDEKFAQWFTNRFKQLSQWMAPPPGANLLPLLLEITDIQRVDQFLNTVPQRIASFFNCRKCDIWRLDPEKNEITRFGVPSVRLDISEGGIAGEVLVRKQAVHVVSTRLSPSYNPQIDGDLDESVLAVPVSSGGDDQMTYVIALRGPNEGFFSSVVQDNLNTLGPFILQALTNADTFSAVDDEFEKSQLESEGLAGLLQVVEELSQHLDTKILIDQIMEKGRALTDSDRCSLFLVNSKRDKLISFLHQGLKNSIELPMGQGIAGQTVNNGKIMNIADAYECEYFDRNTDKESGYRTKSILSVPIPNNRGEIIGVTEMVNKKNGHPFTEWDTKLIQIFNVFAGISLENAKLFEESQSMSTQLRSFFDISFSMAKSEDIRPLLQDIMGNARKTIGATRASIFLLDETANCFSTFLAETDDEKSVPSTLPITSGIISAVAKSKNGLIENDVYHNPNFNRSVDINTGFKTVSILASPIFDKTGKLIGVVEMLNKQSNLGKDEPFTDKDLEILNAFSGFSSVAIENCRLKDIVQNGDVEVELYKWVGASEREKYDIPIKLQLPAETQKTLLSLNCFSCDYIGIDHFKELFFFFNHFNLLETFKITNAQFFRFIATVSRSYNNPPYHNWTHACDVSQYVTYEIEVADLTKVLTKFEVFALLIACICHDTNHQGFNNIYNIKAETPLGILYKDQSVMEMHHITQSIPIICQDDINLFQNLSPADVKKMWNLFIKLILSTDMAKHFELVKSTQAALDSNEWDINKPEHHTMALQLLLKVGDISNVSRPFELADKWCDILNTEFFRQGDLEKSSGIGLTSPLNDREHPDKPKSQIGFYNFICIPLYQTIARIFPPLQVNVDSLKSNLNVWMELAAANKAKEEAEKAKQEAEKAKQEAEKAKQEEKKPEEQKPEEQK